MPKQEVELATLKDIHFYYTSVASPVLTKKAKDDGFKFNPEDPKANTEYVVKVAMTDEKFRKLKKKYKAKNFPNAKEFTLAEFEEAFHKDGGMPDFGDAEDLVVVKFAQKARSKAGQDMRPPTMIGIKGKVQDRNGETIGADTIIGNGTKGILQVRPVDFGQHGLYLYPHALCITELVKYEPADSGVDYDSFGIEELDDADTADMNPENDDFSDEDDFPF